MTIDPMMVRLFAGLVVLLSIASAIDHVLKRRVTTPGGRATVDNLNARVRAWWLMIAVFAVAFAAGKGATLALFAVTSFYCLREFVSLTPTRPADRRALAFAFYLFLLFLITDMQASDVLQYVFGKLFGRHPVAPAVSPSKTWEGLIGGGAAAVGGGPRYGSSRRYRQRAWRWPS